MTIVAWRHLETFDPSQRARMRGGTRHQASNLLCSFPLAQRNKYGTCLASCNVDLRQGSVDLSYKPTQIHDLAGADRMQGPAFASMTSRYGWIDVTGPDRRGTK